MKPADPQVPPGYARCIRPACKNPFLPAAEPYFYKRGANNPKLRSECACCTREAAHQRFLRDPERHRRLVAANTARLKRLAPTV